MTEPSDGKIRVDKWLWYARFFKSRGLAADAVTGGSVRVNGLRAGKPAQTVRPGDVLTFAQGKQIRVVRIEAPGTRRGPAPEAQALYTDLSPPVPKEPSPEDPAPAAAHVPGRGRPTKRDRREIDAWRRGES